VIPRQTYHPPKEHELIEAMAEAASEAGWSLHCFALPAVKRLFHTISGKNLAQQEVPTPYKVTQALSSVAERKMIVQVSKWAKLAPLHSLSATLDGWQSRRGIELISCGIGGLPQLTPTSRPEFIGVSAVKHKVSHNLVVRAHNAAIRQHVGEQKVGLHVHDQGSNILKAAQEIADKQQREGHPVYSTACALHVLHNATKDLANVLCKNELAFSGRIAASVHHHRRVRNLFNDLVKDRTRVLRSADGTEKEVSDRAEPARLGRTKCLCIPDNLCTVSRRQDVWIKIAADAAVGRTFRKAVLNAEYTPEVFYSDAFWARQSTLADVLQPCAFAMRRMERSCTRLPDTITIYRWLKQEMQTVLHAAVQSGHLTHEQVAQATETLQVRLKEKPLPLTSWALVPANAGSLTAHDRAVIKKWLSDHAHLYNTTPGLLRAAFQLYVMKDANSAFARGADVWEHAASPARFWRVVAYENQACDLAHVGEQLVGFLAHTGDLERAHSILGWLQNKHRNALRVTTLQHLACINRCLFADRQEAAHAAAAEARSATAAARRAAAAF
jgi:hypothetical protein